MTDKLGGRPWIAWLAAFVAFMNVTVGVYLSATVLPELEVDPLVAAGGFISFSSIAYGFNASRVKTKEIEVSRTTEIEDA